MGAQQVLYMLVQEHDGAGYERRSNLRQRRRLWLAQNDASRVLHAIFPCLHCFLRRQSRQTQATKSRCPGWWEGDAALRGMVAPNCRLTPLVETLAARAPLIDQSGVVGDDARLVEALLSTG